MDIVKKNNIRFIDYITYGEDTLFQYYVYMFRTGKDPTIRINNVLYYYRQHASSLMRHQSLGAYNKHVDDLVEMDYIYQRDYNNRIVNDQRKLNEIKMRQHMAIEGVLAILPRSHYKYNDIIGLLEKEGLYPYPMLWWKLKRAKGIKAKINAFYRMLFRYKIFYRFYYHLCKLIYCEH